MRLTDKVAWAEGVLLLPQHFQQLDRYHESRLGARLEALDSTSWGALRIELDPSALQQGNVALLGFEGVLPDGTPLVVDGARGASAPKPRPVGAHFPPAQRALAVHLAIPVERSGVNNYGDEGAPLRYTLRQQRLADASRDDRHAELQLAIPSLTLLFGDESRTGFVSLPIAELVRDPLGGLALSDRFVPPCLRIAASPVITTRIEALLRAGVSRLRLLSERRRVTGEGRVEFTSADVTRYLQLNALNTMLPLNPGPCDGLTVSDVTIDAQPPDLSGFTRRWRALEFVNGLHVTSDPDMIRRFLILKVGEPCTELRRAESERILRAQPFLADATVLAVPTGTDSVRLQVTTVDEFSIVGAAMASNDAPFVKRLKLGDGNLMGEGVYALAEWRDGLFYRDAFGARVTDYQLFGRPYQVTIEGAREELGDQWAGEASHPFLTDLQRAAWRLSAGESRGYFGFIRENAPNTALEYRRSYADIGGVIRIGEPGRLSLFGASLSRERELPGTLPVFITDSGLYADTGSTLVGRYGGNRTARINALWGVRNVRFVRVTGFDALTATQDLRRGFQLGVLAGRSLSVLGSTDDDIFVAADLYAGWAQRNTFIGLQFLGEGRQNYDENHWDGILGSGRAASYIKFSSAHTLITSFEYSGGWEHRTPFQLRLGDAQGGVRGYSDSRVVGNQRGVVRVEERLSWRSMGRAADVGWALFGDAGKMWAGEVPFGVDTPIRYGVGVGFLAAVPARSRRLWRLDFAVPVTRDEHAGWEIRLTSSDLTRVFWHEPQDVARSRERFVPASIFSWP